MAAGLDAIVHFFRILTPSSNVQKVVLIEADVGLKSAQEAVEVVAVPRTVPELLHIEQISRWPPSAILYFNFANF